MAAALQKAQALLVLFQLSNKMGRAAETSIPLRPSLFPHVPPYVLFSSSDNSVGDFKDGGMDWHIKRNGLVWQHVYDCVQRSGFTVSEVGACLKGSTHSMPSTPRMPSIHGMPNTSGMPMSSGTLSMHGKPCTCGTPSTYGGFHQGRRMTPKKWSYFFYGEAYISLNLSIKCLQPICMYQLRVSSGPHDFHLGLALV